MPPPSQLAIATSSVRRLLKEEASYKKELVGQEDKVKVLEQKIQSGDADEDGNGAFMLKQHQIAIEETKAVFGPLRQRIVDATEKLEGQIAVGEQSGGKEDELEQAKATLAEAKAA
jgi:tubulin-specific chaperone A